MPRAVRTRQSEVIDYVSDPMLEKAVHCPRRAGDDLTVESASGQGSTFTLVLPKGGAS